MKPDEGGLLEKFLRTVRRRKWIILQATIAVPILALLFTLTQEKQYTASATLLFTESQPTLSESSSVIDPTRAAATNTELATLPVVAERAAKKLGNGVSGAEVLGAVTVTPSAEANTATIEAVDSDPEQAAEIANAYGEAYIAFRRATDRGQLEDAIKLAETTLAEQTPEDLEGAVGEELKTQLDQLRLEQALQTGGAELVQTATPPSEASSPHPKRNVILGVVLGLLLGLGVAGLLEGLDRRIRSSDEMEDLYKLPVLARIPRSHRLDSPKPASLDIRTPEGEAFRMLRANLRYFNVDEGSHTILFVSPEEGDGKSTVARGLAMTMAGMGDSVVLVEADLRKGGAFKLPDGSPVPGLSNVLTGTPIERTLLRIEADGDTGKDGRALAVLSSGQAPPNPGELLESKRMDEVLAKLHEEFDYVIIDSPALGAVSDALTLVGRANEVVVVGGLGKTTRDDVTDVRKQFTLLEKEPVGVIVNFAQQTRARYSSYYHAERA
jgi:succinoglycan biosynthesis transport protein ExoP